jgi:rubrerythrin
MPKQNEAQTMAEYMNCLSMLEINTATLYKEIADKTDMPLIKSLFMQISIDSEKHSVILKGVSESISPTKGESKDCMKKMGKSFEFLVKAQKEIKKIKKIDEKSLPWLIEKLSFFESVMGEDYYIFTQLHSLEVLVQKINEQYSIDFTSAKHLFTKIIQDEDHHRELLETIRGLVVKKEVENDNSPAVKYQNPDSWSRPMPVDY